MLSNLLHYLILYLSACWEMLVEMGPYICLGFFMTGLIHIFVDANTIIKYLGKGRFRSVIYAALLGIPLPLCSCSVLPTTAGLKKQGANNGAAMAFLIATPETGVDSIAVTYALLDPIMTIFRPIAAFITAVMAGFTENILGNSYSESAAAIRPDRSCRVDKCCDGDDCSDEEHRQHHTLAEKFYAALKYGFGTILDDIAGWLLVGIAIAGAIHVIIPESFLRTYFHGGLFSMLVMLVVGIPFYICATASTPIAAALILKGVSPGAALVLLLAGPATNAATIAVVYGLFKKRATAIYLGSISTCAVAMGLLLDKIYATFQISVHAVAGAAGEIIPHWLSIATALALMILMANTLIKDLRQRQQAKAPKSCNSTDCGCHTHE